MSELLNEIERRVLGVLLEKSLAQPDYYPMTVNAVVAASNQKSNRDPMLALDEDAVWHTLDALKARGLAAMVLPSGGARTNRFKHQVDAAWEWDRSQRAVMAELLLRGPQTVNELRTRCARMVALEDTEAVSNVLASLAQLDPPVVAVQPRGSGQQAVRHTHLLYPEDEQPTTATEAPVAVAATGAASPGGTAPPTPTAASEVEAFQTQFEALQQEVGELHEELADTRRRLEVIENQLL